VRGAGPAAAGFAIAEASSGVTGPDEVTFGPFPTELLRGVISKGLDDPAVALGDFVVLGEQRI